MSVSSFSSAHDSNADSFRPNNINPGEDDNFFEEPQTIQLGVFGVLYTVSKEKELTSVKFAFFRLFLDFLQLWLLIVNPSYGWNIQGDSTVWQVVSFIQLNAFLSARGYVFFLALLYVFVGLLFVNLALSIWVAHSFSNNRFEYVWPIQFLRWFGLIFYQVLDIAALTLLLVTLDCNYFASDAKKFHNQEFPEIMCWSMPHIIHVGVSLASIVIFVIAAACMVLSEMELNPLTRNYMAIADTRDEGVGFAIKTIVTIVSVMFGSEIKAMSLIYLFFFILLFYIYVRWVPFIYSTLNYVRCASYSTVLYSSMLLVLLAFGPHEQKFRQQITLALWIGMAPAALVGAFCCHLRLLNFNRVLARFRDATPGTKSKSIYRFSDVRQVQICARCCRRWIDEDTLEPAAVALSEQVIKAGMLQLPQDPRMIILYSSFLIEVQGSYQSGYTQLQTAKKQSPGVLERFAIFSREQEHAQKASGANSGESAVDLVSYVEFQRNHRLVVRAHREALLAIRAFWGLLLRSNVNFNHLSRALNRIEYTVKAAERAYRSVLARHGSSARIVRLYGKFLESVKFDPWAASKWYTEADRLEEEAEHSKEALQLGGIEMLLPMAQAGMGAERSPSAMEGLAFICINAQGTIQVASNEAHSLLGYSKNELKGKDVGIIMPAPFAERHTAYVRNYVNTGQSALLDRKFDIVVLTKSRQVLPVRIQISKVSGLNEDSIFCGLLEPTPSSPDTARMWILGTGAIVSTDAAFCDWLGYDSTDLTGKSIEDLLIEKDIVRDAIKSWSRASNPPTRHSQRQRRQSFGDLLSGGLGLPSPVPGDKDAKSPMSGPEKHSVGWLRRASFLDATAVNNARVDVPSAADTSVVSHPPMVLHRAAWLHKFWDPLELETYIQPGAIGNVKVHSVIMRRCASTRPAGMGYPNAGPDPYYHEMMLVADHRGRVLHVTTALAAALGRTTEAIRAGGMFLLLPYPTCTLHGPWMAELANPRPLGPVSPVSAPVHSCRSGVAVSLTTHSAQYGPGLRQFRLKITQRLTDGGASKLHVVTMAPVNLEQALSERRLRLSVDFTGSILSADEATPTPLFGVNPSALVGSNISKLVDLFQMQDMEELLEEGGGGAVTPGRVPGGANPAARDREDMLESAKSIFREAASRRLAKALLQLACSSAESPGCSWRVGVTLPTDEALRTELEQLAAVLGPEDLQAAAALLAPKKVPGVMTVRLVRRPPPPDTEPSSPAFGAAGPFSNDANFQPQPRSYLAESTSGATAGGANSLSAGGRISRSHLVMAGGVKDFGPAAGQEQYLYIPYNSRSSIGDPRGGSATAGSSSIPVGRQQQQQQQQQQARGGGGGPLAGELQTRFNLPEPASQDMQTPVRLDAGPGYRSPLEQQMMMLMMQQQQQQGGAFMGRTPVAEADEQEEGQRLDQQQGVQAEDWMQASQRPRGARRGEPSSGGSGRSRPSGARGPVAEGLERPSAHGSSGLPLSDDDETALEHLAASVLGTSSAVTSRTTTNIGLEPNDSTVSNAAAAAAAARPGASALAAAVAAAVGKTAPDSSPNSRSSGMGASTTPSPTMSQRLLLGTAAGTPAAGPTVQAAAAAAPAGAAAPAQRAALQGGTSAKAGVLTAGTAVAAAASPTAAADTAASAVTTPYRLAERPAAALAPSPPAAAPAAAAKPASSPPGSAIATLSTPSLDVEATLVELRSPVWPAISAAAPNLVNLRLSADKNPAAAGPMAAAAGPMAAQPLSNLVVEVELWRADLLSGVLEVDERGRVVRVDTNCPLARSGFVLGIPPANLPGRQVSELLPLPSSGVQGLMEAGAGKASAAAGTGGADGGPASGVRGAMKRQPSQASKMGPPVTVKVRHHTDGCELVLQVQAVRRSGPLGCAYLVLRPSVPSFVQPGFYRWLHEKDATGMMPAISATGYTPNTPTQMYSPGPNLLMAMNSRRATASGLLGTAAADRATSVAASPAAAAVGRVQSNGGLVQKVSSGDLQSMAAAGAAAAAAAAAASAAAAAPPTPPSLASLSLMTEYTVSPTRVAALRGATMPTAAGVPSRLSNPAGMPGDSGPVELLDTGMLDAGLISPALEKNGAVGTAPAGGADGTTSMVSSPSLDTAYDPTRSKTVEELMYEGEKAGGGSIKMVRSLSRLEAMAHAGQLGRIDVSTHSGQQAASPRATAALPQDADVAPSSRPDDSRKRKLSKGKNSMVRSWVFANGMDPAKGKSEPPSGIGKDGRKRSTSRDGDGDGDNGDSDGGDSTHGAEADMTSADEGRSSVDPEPVPDLPPSDRIRPSTTDDGHDTEVEAEAGAVVANYSVGKRFKKLHKLLTSPLALRPLQQLQWRTTAAIALVVMVHTVTFILLLLQLLQQEAAVGDLYSVAQAARKVHEVSITGVVLDKLYGGNSYVEGLPQFGEPFDETEEDLYVDLTDIAVEMKELHRGVYLGFRKLRRISTDYGLRDFWDEPNMNMSFFYDRDDPSNPNTLLPGSTEPSIMRMGLWEAGNYYYSKTLDLVNNGRRVVDHGVNFTTWSTWRFLQENGVTVIFNAYSATLDALVQLTVAESKSIYRLQLIILVLEGGLMCICICVYMWIVARKYSRKRHEMYNIFIQIPLGVTRGLANMSLVLEAADEEEDDDNELQVHEMVADAPGVGGGDEDGLLTDATIKAAAGERRPGVSITGAPGGPSTAAKRRGSLTFGKGTAPEDDTEAAGSGRGGPGRTSGSRLAGFTGAMVSLIAWRKRAKVSPQHGSSGHHQHRHKRRLLHSNRLAYALVTPFVLWGAAIITVNLVGYYSLEKLSAPIATLNVVNFVVLRFHRVLFYVLEVASAVSEGAVQYLKSILVTELSEWKLEYAAMLYGNEVVPNSETPHFALADVGVLFGGFTRPAHMLYHATTCMAIDPESCQSRDSPYYEITNNGLDVLVRSQFTAVESLLAQPNNASGLNSSEFQLMWSTGQTDVEGGLMGMANLFLDEVQGSYRSVVVQQIVMFCIAWVWVLFFMMLQLRPLIAKSKSEMRRIAELLSQLPAEVDCEALVTGVILGERTAAMPAGFAKGGVAGKSESISLGASMMKRRPSMNGGAHAAALSSKGVD